MARHEARQCEDATRYAHSLCAREMNFELFAFKSSEGMQARLTRGARKRARACRGAGAMGAGSSKGKYSLFRSSGKTERGGSHAGASSSKTSTSKQPLPRARHGAFGADIANANNEDDDDDDAHEYGQGLTLAHFKAQLDDLRDTSLTL